MDQPLEVAHQRIRELQESILLLEERHVVLQAALNELRTVAEQAISAWDQMSNRMQRQCPITFHAAMRQLIVTIEEKN